MTLNKAYLFGALLFIAVGCKKNSGTTVQPPPVTPPPVDNTTFANPLLTSGPDPWVIKKDNFYYYTHTSGNRIQLWKTTAMSQLNNTSPVTIWAKPATGPNSENVWAPELHFLDGKWYMYYTAGARVDQSLQRIFVLENSSADPTQGTWVDKGKVADPAADQWAIDATVFEYNNNRYMVWSGFASATDNTQRLYIAKMQNPWTLSTARTLISAPGYTWETMGAPPAVNEGPEILKNAAGRVFLVFSASGCWTDDYAMGMLTLKDGGDPLAPADWVKSANPVFVKKPDNQAYGPGHCAFFKSPDGTQDWIIYHANSFSGQGCGNDRSPRMQKFTWNADGTPNFGEPVKIATAITKPSGE